MSLKPVITKLVLLTGLVLALLVAATAATASTTLDIKATINGPGMRAVEGPTCPVWPLCGQGEVVGLGQVDEAVVGLAGPRTAIDEWTFADGSKLVLLVTHEIFSCPGANDCRSFNEHSFGNPFSVTLTATVDGGLSTGRFAGASGTLTGELKVAGGVAITQLSGQLTFA